MEWKEVKIGDLGQIITGKTPKTAIKKNWGGKIPFLSPSDDMSNKTSPVTARTLTELGVAEVAKCLIPANSICVSCIGSDLGKVVKTDRELVTNQQINTIVPHSNVDSDFVYYLMCIVGKELNYISKTSTAVPIINKSTFSDWNIVIPEKVEDQRRIASILSSLDRKIELNNKINADLEEMAQAIFKNWFVDFEPFKDGKFVDSELGKIPEGWKVGCLGDLITIKYGKDHKKLDDGTFPVYGSGGFMRFVNSWLYNGESVLIPRKGTLDNIMYVCEKFWTVDTMFFSVPKMDYVMKYVYNYIKRFDFSKMNEGTSVPSNTAARLNKMPILIPTHEILEMYDETLCPIYNKRKMKDKESRTLSLLRDTLLPRLMSGEIEVPE